MGNLEELTEHTSVDIKTQMTTRSSVIGAVSLREYSVVIESGNQLTIGTNIRKNAEDHFGMPVKYLFLTHAHSDHRGGMNAFKDTKLLLSTKCKDNLPKNIRLSGWTVETFYEKLKLQEEDISVEFYHVGGHSLGSSVAYVPEEKVLFAGDLFFEDTINLGLPFLGFYQSRPRKTGNPEECLAAFRNFQSMKLDYIVPGHGEIIGNPQEYLVEQIDFFNSLKSFIIEEIKKEKTLEDIELPKIGPIARAYQIIETKTQKYKALRFMDTMLGWLKKAFYNHYKENE